MTNNNSQKDFAMPLIIAIVALVVVVTGVGYYATRNKPQTTPAAQAPTGEKTLPDGTAVKADGTMVKPDGTVVKPDGTMEKKEEGTIMKNEDRVVPSSRAQAEGMAKYAGTVLAGKSAPLLDFTKADYDAAVASDKLVALYFYANWCPICKEEVVNALYPAFNELTTEDVVGIRINYKDSDTDADEGNLARQYGIPYQHTKVFVKNGKQILKAPDSWDKARYLAEMSKALAR